MNKIKRSNCNLPGSGKVKWVDKAQRSGSSSTTRRKISKEITEKLSILINATKENLFVLIFEGKVQSLRWEISDNIGEITTPVTEESLFTWDTNETIDHTWKVIYNVNM